MSSYHSSFKFLNKKSDENFGWIIAHFDPDNGETDSYLSQNQIYTDSYNGTKRTLYGTKYNSVANVKITVVKQDGSDFSLRECRDAYKWLTGNPEASWMDLYIGDEVKYRLLCTIQDVKPQKMDARTVGLNIYCESLSPWAYSPLITVNKSIVGADYLVINNESDDLYTPVYPKITYKNISGNYITIENQTISEITRVKNLGVNEIITLDNNMLITSDNSGKIFGNSFNFTWPRLKSGTNKFHVVGNGDLTFEYYYPIKMGDCATNINVVRDPICDDYNNIQVDALPWARISDTPTTIKGYGITDAYTKTEIDTILDDFVSEDVYTKDEVDTMLKEIITEIYGSLVDSDGGSISIYSSEHIDYLLSKKANSEDVYTKTEIKDDYYDSTYINDNYYNKAQIDTIISELNYDPSTGASTSVTWSQITGKPTTLSGYSVKSEVQDMINESRNEMLANDVYTKTEVDALLASIQVNIDEEELDAMLAEVLV
jgi:hypothetical protein